MHAAYRGATLHRTGQSHARDIVRGAEQIVDVRRHNDAQFEAFHKGEEGLDYVHVNPEADPRFITERKLVKQAKRQAAAEGGANTKHDDPDSDAARLREFKKRVMSIKFDKDDVKLYPGSAKGRRPEDDKKFYAEWFFANRPEKLRSIEEEVVFPAMRGSRREVRPCSRFRRRGPDETRAPTAARTRQASSSTSSKRSGGWG